MIKKFFRLPVLKVLAFAVIFACVFAGVYETSDRAYQYCEENNGNGFIYNMEGSFEDSQFLKNQINSALSSVDSSLYYDSEWLLGPDGKVDKKRIHEAIGNGFIGNVSFRHNDIIYDGGASKGNDNYYMEVTPGTWESNGIAFWGSSYMRESIYESEDEMETDLDYGDSSSDAYSSGVTKPGEKYSDSDYILVSVSKEQAAPYRDQWGQGYRMMVELLTRLLAYMLAALAVLIYLLCVAGKKPADDEIHMLLIDRMPVEINLMLIAAAITGAGVMVFISIEVAAEQLMRAAILPLSVGCGLCALLVTALIMSLVRNAANHTFVSRSLILRACRWCWRSTKKFFNGKWLGGLRECLRKLCAVLGKWCKGFGGWAKRGWNNAGETRKTVVNSVLKNYKARNVVLIFFGYTLVLAFFAAWFGLDFDNGVPFILGVVWFGVSCSFILKRINGFDKIAEGIKRLRAGELEYKLSGLPEGVFSGMAEDINSLGDGMRSAIKNEVRAERMKSELITNVSHDLKTPLTSILNYAELLCQEQLTPEEANDYAKIIYQKSIRLKNLTSDLFDISKVQSGAEQMECEKLDACTLVRQALAEQEGAIRESGLVIKASIPDTEVPIWADGKKMSRVMENLLGNCVKYALTGTRVYLTVVVQGEATALIELKNIANYEMDFDTEEIMERFVRGDESRSTDGSGLGLAIAKSYVTACGGSMEIGKDGDLFKVRITFPLFSVGTIMP